MEAGNKNYDKTLSSIINRIEDLEEKLNLKNNPEIKEIKNLIVHLAVKLSLDNYKN